MRFCNKSNSQPAIHVPHLGYLLFYWNLKSTKKLFKFKVRQHCHTAYVNDINFTQFYINTEFIFLSLMVLSISFCFVLLLKVPIIAIIFLFILSFSKTFENTFKWNLLTNTQLRKLWKCHTRTDSLALSVIFNFQYKYTEEKERINPHIDKYILTNSVELKLLNIKGMSAIF